jgi:hypothetical protein
MGGGGGGALPGAPPATVAPGAQPTTLKSSLDWHSTLRTPAVNTEEGDEPKTDDDEEARQQVVRTDASIAAFRELIASTVVGPASNLNEGATLRHVTVVSM